MSEMQKQFEDWIKTQIIKPNLGKRDSRYDNPVVNECWKIWQASRAALIVELPPEHEVVYGGYDGAELRYALELAGINIEGGAE